MPQRPLATAHAANKAIADLNRAHARYAEANFLDRDYFGTVGTILVVRDDHAHLIHVGDTLAVHVRDGMFRLLIEIGTAGVAADGFGLVAATVPAKSTKRIVIRKAAGMGSTRAVQAGLLGGTEVTVGRTPGSLKWSGWPSRTRPRCALSTWTTTACGSR